MKKHDTKKVREAIGALDELEVDAPEILRRLREDDCGIGYPVDISRRAVYYHRAAYREEKARAATKADQLNGSLASSKQRAVDLLNRELDAHERRRPGSMGAKEAAAVERIHRALVNIERVERKAKGRPSANGSSNGNGEAKSETALERLARQHSAQPSANEPPRPDTQSP
jgi:hypothetical protein